MSKKEKSQYTTPLENTVDQPIPPEYDYATEQYVKRWIDRLRNSKAQRQTVWDEFNGMNFIQNYETNKRAAMSYAPPRRNEGDDRVVTGVTEDKKETILSAALNYNFKPTIRAYDDNDTFIDELGDAFEILVEKAKRSSDVTYNEAKVGIYEEFFTQGVSYVEISATPKYQVEKIPVASDFEFDVESEDFDIDSFDPELFELESKSAQNPYEEAVKEFKSTWQTKITKTDTMLEASLIPGNAVYLGNYRERYLEKQPYIAIRYETSYDQAALFFKDWKMWKHVPKLMKSLDGMKEDSDAYVLNAWVLEGCGQNRVEIIKCQDKWNNDLAIFVNGILMTPPEYPLTSIDGSQSYSIVDGHCYIVSGQFAVSKGIPGKIKVDQALVDEFYRALAMKSRQSYRPPLANNTGRQISKKIFLPSQITDDIDVDQLKPILPNAMGITGPDLQAIQVVKSIIDDKSFSSTFQGNIDPKSAATNTITAQNQTMMKIGLPLYGLMELERKICEKFIHAILHNWTEKQDEKVDKVTKEIMPVYKNVELEGDLPDGVNGLNMIEYTENQYDPEQILAEEQLLSTFRRRPVRKMYINPKLLKNTRLKFFIEVEAIEKNSDILKRQQFSATVKEGFEIFGRERFNQAFLEGMFAQVNKWSKDKAFVPQNQTQPGPADLMQMMAQQQAMGGYEQSMPPVGQVGINNTIGNTVPNPEAAQPPTPEELAQLTQ